MKVYKIWQIWKNEVQAEKLDWIQKLLEWYFSEISRVNVKGNELMDVSTYIYCNLGKYSLYRQ